jgi:hypothetical protein
MTRRSVAVIGGLVVVAAAISLMPVLVGRQTPATIDTAWGEADLQGIWYAFEDVPLQRPAEYAGREFLTEEEFAAKLKRPAWLARVAEGTRDPSKRQGRDRRQERGSQEDVSGAYNAVFTPGRDHIRPSRRTSLIVDPPDGQIPPMTPEAQKRIAAFQDFQEMLVEGTPMGKKGSRPSPTKFDAPPSYNLARLRRPPQGPEDRAGTERCLGLSLPSFGGRVYHRIVQSPGYVAIFYEPSGHAGANRVIPTGNRPRLPGHVRQYLGDSHGRWEGKTLVIETTNFTRKTDYRGSRENLRLVERFTRLDAETVRYEVTVEDPTTWTRPWTIRADMMKLSDHENQLYEPGCHEGNYGIIGILSGTRSEEKTFAEGRGPDPYTKYVFYDEVREFLVD